MGCGGVGWGGAREGLFNECKGMRFGYCLRCNAGESAGGEEFFFFFFFKQKITLVASSE